LKGYRGARLKFYISAIQAEKESEVLFLGVGTPQAETREAGLSQGWAAISCYLNLWSYVLFLLF
jgi:UDP-glucose 6-dehydrogenase